MNYDRRGFSHHSLGIAGISHDFSAHGHKKGREIMRALGLFVAFIGLVGIAGGCKDTSTRPGKHTSTRPVRVPADGLFRRAWNAFDDGDYKKAQEAFEDLVARFPGTPEEAKASVILHLCKAHEAVNKFDWSDAQEHEKAARDQLNDVRARTDQNSELYQWTQDFEDVIDKFKDKRLEAWEFRDKKSRAQDLLSEGNFKAALDEVKKFDRPGVVLPDAFREELRVFRAKVELAKFRTDCSSLISRGDGLVADGKLDMAKVVYLIAKTLLESKEGLVLPKKERDKLLEVLAAKLKSVATRGRYEDAIAAAEKARKEGNKVGEGRPLRPRTKPSAKAEARIKALRSEVDMARARALHPGNTSEAIKVLKKLLEYDPGNSDAKALLKGLERRANWRTVLSKAHALYRKQDYAAALVKYEESAALLPPDATVKQRMVDCRYRIKVNEAERLRRDGKLVEAIRAYEDGPLNAPWIKARQELCSRVLKYRQHLAAGDEAQKNKDWKSALDEYSKARKIKDSAEIRARMSITKYSRFEALGTAALNDADPKSAKEYFERAKAIMDSDQIRKLIAKADSLIKA